MLDWAEDEELFNFDDPRSFRTLGERAANALTPLQQWHVEQFVNVSTGRAKIIGIHAPPIGPFTEWSDSELMKGVKTYAPGADSRARKPNGEIIRLTSHPLFAIGLRDNPNLVTAEHGSFVSFGAPPTLFPGARRERCKTPGAENAPRERDGLFEK